MSYTRREVERAKRVLVRFQDLENLERHPRRDERFARLLANEFGAIRRGMILALKNEIDRQTAKLPIAMQQASVPKEKGNAHE